MILNINILNYRNLLHSISLSATILTSLFSSAQQIDTIQPNIEFLTDQLENIAQTTDLNLDYSDLVDDYLYFSKNKIDLNSAQSEKLVQIRLINQVQLTNLQLYINNNGPLLSIYELSFVPGFDESTIQNILPFVSFSIKVENQNFNFKNAFRYSTNQLILRYGQVIEQSEGYKMPADSALFYPGSVYLGSPVKYYARYAFNYRNQLRIGFTFDKDAGEVIFKNSLSDTLLSLIGSQANPAFDFFSAHAYIADIGVIKEAVIGDYHLEFGQGLTMWSGLAFGKSAQSVEIKRFGQGIRPNTSANENRFFRGAATTISFNDFELTAFYSKNTIDANTVGYDLVTEETVSSIQETGLHRTINELLDKNSLNMQAFGGRINYSKRNFQIGATAFQTDLDSEISPGTELYDQFDFTGNRLNNYGFDFSYNLKKINLFGEFSGSSDKGYAGIGGINALLTERFVFSLLYHNYNKNYHNFYANPFAESSSISNESGLYFGFNALLSPKWNLAGYLDFYRFPWLRYGVSAPSIGNDFLVQLNYTPVLKTSIYLRYRHKTIEENYREEYQYTPSIATVNQNEFRFFVSYSPFDFLVLINRLDYVLYQNEYKEKENGYLIYQDVLYRPNYFPLEITFRYAIFSTDSYDSRIYTYENDVLYSFTIPSYYDKGQRVYLMLKWKATQYLDAWFRIGRTTYNNRTTVGSGNDEILGNHKTEIRVQLMFKL